MSKLKVGFLTTFNAPCGIADYARNLAREIRILGNDVVVLGNLPYGSGEVDNVNEFEVHKVFEVEIHTGKQFFDFEMIYGIIDKIDVLHIQFESAIYTRSLLSTLLKEIKGKIPIVVTIHSSCNWLDSDFDAITTPVKKLAEMNNFIWIPHGIPEFPKIERPIDLVVSSIGLGRNMDDIVVNTIKQIESDISWTIQRLRVNKKLIDPESLLMKLLAFTPQIVSAVISMMILWIVIRYAPELLNAMKELATELKKEQQVEVIGSFILGLIK